MWLCVCVFVCPTLPRTAVQLHSHADGGRHSGDGDQPDVAGDDRRVEVVDDWGVGVLVSLHHLDTNITWGTARRSIFPEGENCFLQRAPSTYECVTQNSLLTWTVNWSSRVLWTELCLCSSWRCWTPGFINCGPVTICIRNVTPIYEQCSVHMESVVEEVLLFKGDKSDSGVSVPVRQILTPWVGKLVCPPTQSTSIWPENNPLTPPGTSLLRSITKLCSLLHSTSFATGGISEAERRVCLMLLTCSFVNFIIFSLISVLLLWLSRLGS